MEIKTNNPESRRYQPKTLFRISEQMRKDFKVVLLNLDLSQQSVLMASISLFNFYQQYPDNPINKPFKRYFDRLIESARSIEAESRKK